MNSYGCQGLLKHALQKGVHKHFLSSTSICSVETPHLCFPSFTFYNLSPAIYYNNSLSHQAPTHDDFILLTAKKRTHVKNDLQCLLFM